MAEALEGRQGLESWQRKAPKRRRLAARWSARHALTLAIALSVLLWLVLGAIAIALLPII